MKRLFPCGTTRREFVWQMGGGFAGAALTSLLGSDGFFTRQGRAADVAKGPLAPKNPHFPTKAKNVIFLMMNGAPSQVDTFDYKPELEKYAGKTLPPDKKYINSGGRKVGWLTPNWRPFRPGDRGPEILRLRARAFRPLSGGDPQDGRAGDQGRGIRRGNPRRYRTG